MTIAADLTNRLAKLTADFEQTYIRLDIVSELERLEALEAEINQPDLWNNPGYAQQVSQDYSQKKSEVEPWLTLKSQLADMPELLAINDTDWLKEVAGQLDSIEAELAKLKSLLRFSGKYDKLSSIVRITSGVGGLDAEDFAAMLERMYQKFCSKNNLDFEILERSLGEAGGLKTGSYQVSGNYAYGRLRSEHGVHRLVRLSPFNADNLRQTSFALVEVLPELSNDDLQINEADLKIDYYRSGGHGGQSVNTTDSAVRITHLPTNTTVAVQNERSQIKNKAIAMSILRAKLDELKQQQQVDDLAKLRAGESASWGKQIRNYVLHPYTMVKDTRTKHESTDVEAVLDGEIGDFIEAYLEAKSPSPAV